MPSAVKPLNSTTSDQIEKTLTASLGELIQGKLIQIERFDPSKHIAKKFKVTGPKGEPEIYEDLIDAIDDIASQSDVVSYINNEFDENFDDYEDARRMLYDADLERDYLVHELKCRVDDV